MEQNIYKEISIEEFIENEIIEKGFRNLFIVCGNNCKKLCEVRTVVTYKDGNLRKTWFSNFSSNPDFSSVQSGIRLFRQEKCDSIIAIGGGSAMDVAKCIKAGAFLTDVSKVLESEFTQNEIPLIVVPTTAGTGSEATHFAVIYDNGEKYSVKHESLVPNGVLFLPSFLEKLPLYQKQATLCDALCHAIESMWSVNSTDTSRDFALKSISIISENMDRYLSDDISVNNKMFEASHLAGKAINITQTTAGHAMCYKLTSLYGIAHGHAAALCVRALWEYMILHFDKCKDVIGQEQLIDILGQIALGLGEDDIEGGERALEAFLCKMRFEPLRAATDKELEILVNTVNIERLRNTPITLDKEDIREIYRSIFDYENRKVY